jgi:hypothetical protein
MVDRYNFDDHISAIKHCQSLQVGLKARIKEMQERLASFESQEEDLRSSLRHAMEETGVLNHKGIEATVFIGTKPPSVKVEAVEMLPEEYTTINIDIRPNKELIKEALQAGVEIEGATLITGLPMLTIRSV